MWQRMHINWQSLFCFVFKVTYNRRGKSVCVCVCVCVTVCVHACMYPSQAIPRKRLVIIVKLGTVTASDMIMHHVLLTFIDLDLHFGHRL